MIIRAVVVALAAAFVAVPAQAAEEFHDSFDGAVNADPTYGLNDNLVQRQGSGAVTYSRVSGRWNSGDVPRPWYAQVNHPNHPGALSMHLGTTAVRVDAPSTGSSVTATLTPVAGNTTSGDWSSIVLSRSANSWGYVSTPDVDLGFLVRANGGVQVFQAGNAVQSFTVPAAASYRVTLTMSASSVDVAVNEVHHEVAVAVPTERLWVYLGRYSDDSATVSLVDDLGMSSMNSNDIRKRNAQLRYFGYYAARITPDGGNHLPEVRGRSNLNWVNISDVDAYRPEVLNDCAPSSCVVYTGNEFFLCSNGCSLYPDYAARWQRLAAAVGPYLDKIAAFYVLDEPFHRGARFDDVAASARLIKQTFPGKKVMLVEAGYKVDDSFSVPAEVDWAGFDEYCKDEARVDGLMTKLEERVPGKELFVVGEGSPMCPEQNDESVAGALYRYSQLLDLHPRFAGMLVFGPWTGLSAPGKPTPSDFPRSADAQERIAARVLGDARLVG